MHHPPPSIPRTVFKRQQRTGISHDSHTALQSRCGHGTAVNHLTNNIRIEHSPTLTPSPFMDSKYHFLEALPPEIWRYVFSFACMDGGTAGCSLSLTSKYFQALCSDIRWFSVSLRGPSQMARFVSAVELASSRAIVRHLQISWNPKLQDPPPGFSVTTVEEAEIVDALCSYQLSEEEDTTLRRRIQDNVILESQHIKRVGDQKYATREACERLFPLVADHLYSLSATFSLGMHVPRSLWTVPFPCLRELTIFGCAMVRFAPVDPSDTILFPSLRCLHLIHCIHDTYLFTMCAPKLTHLRLSSVTTISPWINSLQSIATGSPHVEEHSMLLPWSLQRIYIQGPADRRQHSFRRNMIQEFGSLLKSDGKDVIRILGPLPKTSQTDSDVTGITPYHASDVEKDWAARMEGGTGCWLEDGENVLSLRHSTYAELRNAFGDRFGPGIRS